MILNGIPSVGLLGMKMRALQRHAEGMGVEEDALEDAEEKNEVIALIMAHTEQQKKADAAAKLAQVDVGASRSRRATPVSTTGPGGCMLSPFFERSAQHNASGQERAEATPKPPTVFVAPGSHGRSDHFQHALIASYIFHLWFSIHNTQPV